LISFIKEPINTPATLFFIILHLGPIKSSGSPWNSSNPASNSAYGSSSSASAGGDIVYQGVCALHTTNINIHLIE